MIERFAAVRFKLAPPPTFQRLKSLVLLAKERRSSAPFWQGNHARRLADRRRQAPESTTCLSSNLGTHGLREAFSVGVRTTAAQTGLVPDYSTRRAEMLANVPRPQSQVDAFRKCP